MQESEAAAEVKNDQSNVRRPVAFEEASNADEELLIHQEGIPFTSNEAIEPVTAPKTASARVIDVQEYCSFVPICDTNLALSHCTWPSRTERKVSVRVEQRLMHYLSTSR